MHIKYKKTKNSVRLSVGRNMLWSSFGSFFYLVTQWILTIIIVRISGYEDAGNFSLAMSLTNIFYAFSLYGIRNYQVSDIRNKHSEYAYIYTRIATCIIGFLLCVGFVLINNYSVNVFFIIVLYMLFKLTEAYVDVYHGIDQKNWCMDIIGKSFIMRGLITVVFFTLVLVFTHKLSLSIVSMVLGSFLVIVFYDIPKSQQFFKKEKQVDKLKIKELLVECFPLVLYLCISTSIGSIPRYFLEKYFGSEILGIYAAIATPTIIVQVAANYVFNPLVSLFAEYFTVRNIKGFFNLFIKCIIAIIGISLIAIIGARIFGEFGLELLFGESILEYSYLLIPIIWCTILTAMAWFLCMLMTVIRDFKGLIVSNCIAVVVCIIASIYFIQEYQMNGVNIALIIALSIQIVCLFVFGIFKIRQTLSINKNLE